MYKSYTKYVSIVYKRYSTKDAPTVNLKAQKCTKAHKMRALEAERAVQTGCALSADWRLGARWTHAWCLASCLPPLRRERGPVSGREARLQPLACEGRAQRGRIVMISHAWMMLRAWCLACCLPLPALGAAAQGRVREVDCSHLALRSGAARGDYADLACVAQPAACRCPRRARPRGLAPPGRKVRARRGGNDVDVARAVSSMP